MTHFPSGLIRPDLRGFTGYSSARTSEPHDLPAARIWLNANESATPHTVDPAGRHRRYPDPQPLELVAALAALYDVDPAGLVVGRGSDEAIELLVRTICRPGSGEAVVTASPTFGMYAVSARLHGVPVIDVPQIDEGTGWRVDLDGVARAVRDRGARLVFLASPGNPTGAVLDGGDLVDLAGGLAGEALVVVDEAYAEFGADTVLPALADLPNLAVLRTLSKAHALAGARVGAVVTHPELARVLRAVQAPYPVPSAVTDLALAALADAGRSSTAERVARMVADRDRLRAILGADPRVRTCYPSAANFVLVRADDPDGVLIDLRSAGIVVRDMRHLRGLGDGIRVSVGTPEELTALAAALQQPPTSSPSTTPTTTRTT